MPNPDTVVPPANLLADVEIADIYGVVPRQEPVHNNLRGHVLTRAIFLRLLTAQRLLHKPLRLHLLRLHPQLHKTKNPQISLNHRPQMLVE